MKNKPEEKTSPRNATNKKSTSQRTHHEVTTGGKTAKRNTPKKKNTRYSQELTVNGSRIYISVGKRRGKRNGHTNGHELFPAPLLHSDNTVVTPHMEALAKGLFEMIHARKNGARTKVSPTRLLEEGAPIILDAVEVPTPSKMEVKPETRNPGIILISWQKYGNTDDKVLYLVSFVGSNGRHIIKQVETYNSYLSIKLERFFPADLGTEVKIVVTAGKLPPGKLDVPSHRIWKEVSSCNYLLPKLDLVESDDVLPNAETEERAPFIMGREEPRRVSQMPLFFSCLGILMVILFAFVKYKSILGR